MALPSSCPFASLPASFGREWMPLPSRFSLRPEVIGFYGALSRTFCLSAVVIRSMCRWEPLRPESSACIHADVDSRGLLVAPAASAPKPPSGCIEVPHRRPGLIRRRVIAESVVATGGIALVAWMALRAMSIPPAQTVARGDVTAPVAVPSAPSPAQMEASVPAKGSSDSLSRNYGNETASKNSSSASVAVSPRISAIAVRRGNGASARPTVRPAATSAAEHLSPSSTKWVAVDHYASATTGVRLLPSDGVPISSLAVRADDTGWMDKMQHRRITDAPERFAR
ncbi:hypothetical protein BH160DRAFT_4920 [Burkholderia sp. H160]|nr:hypothetical protein BH160DRAFT_4920 [Burkholderia sp. H160]